MNKKIPAVLGALLVIVLLIGGWLYFQYNNIRIQGDVTLAEYVKDTVLQITKGEEVLLKRGGAGEYVPVREDTVLQEGDYIKVGNNAEATIHWMDDSVTRLASGSEIHITQLIINEQDPTATGISFDIFNGEVWSKAMNIINDKATFSARSGNVIAGIRGTTFDFSVKGKEKKVKAIKHAVYLIGLETNIIAGEEALITDSPANGNSNGSNSNSNSSPKDNVIIQVDPITPDSYQSDWFVQNIGQDQQHEEAVRKRLLELLDKQSADLNNPLRNWKLQQETETAPDLKRKAQLLLQLAAEKFQAAVLQLAKGDRAQGTSLWEEGQKAVQDLHNVLDNISDQDFVLSMKQKLIAQLNLWLKYSFLLLPDDLDITDAMTVLVLDFTKDDPNQATLLKLLDARSFFQMTDALDNGNLTEEEIVRLLAEYKNFLQKLQQRGLEDYECKLLMALKKKLQRYVLNLPEIFSCELGGGGNGSTNGNLNQNSTVEENANQNAVFNGNRNVSKVNRNVNRNINRNGNVNVNTNASVSLHCNTQNQCVMGGTGAVCKTDADCVTTICGNAKCEAGETATSCPRDCAPISGEVNTTGQ